MMDTNQVFSFHRIALVMKRDLIENWKQNLYRLLGIFGGMVFTAVMGLWHIYQKEAVFEYPEHEFNSYVSLCLGIYTFFFLLGSAVYASRLMEVMDTKEKQIAYLMLPATLVEKFTARALGVTLGFLAFFLGGVLLTELTHYVFLPLFGLPAEFYRPLFPAMVRMALSEIDGPLETVHVLLLLCTVAWFLWIHSFYILGGSYWRKNAFLKTFGTFIAVFILLSFVVSQLFVWHKMEWLSAFFSGLNDRLYWVTPSMGLAMLVALLSALTLFNWWLSYRIFARSQIVKPKRFAL